MSELKKILRKKISFVTFSLILIIIIGVLLRFTTLESKSLWYDESLTWQESRMPFSSLIRHVNLWEGNPFLFPFIIGIISRFNDSEFYLRLLPCLFGVLSIIAIYILSQEFMSKKTALISTLLLTLSEAQVVQSQDVRAYSLVVLLTILACYCYFKYLKDKNPKFLYGFTFLSLIFMFVHYSYFIIFLSFNILFVLKNRSEASPCLKSWVLSQIVIICGISILWGVNLQHQVDRFTTFRSASIPFLNRGFLGAVSLKEYGSLLMNTFYISNYFYARDRIVVVLMFFLFIIGLVRLMRQKDNCQIAYFFAIAIFVNLVLAILGKYPYLASRHCIYLSPFYYLFVAKGTESLFRLPGKFKLNKILPWVMLSLIIYTGLSNIHRYLVSPGYTEIRGLISYLKENIRPNERIYIPASVSYVFPYYYSNDPSLCLFGTIWDNSRQEAYGLASEIDDKLKGIQEAWVIFTAQERLNLTLGSLSRQWRIDKIISNPKGDVKLYHILKKN